MQKIWIRWTLAVTITLAVAVYQRMTGPTYPLRGKVNFENVEIKYKLLRSHGGKTDQPVELTLPDTSVSAFLFYKRFKTTDEFTRLKMIRNAGTLVSALPNQPPAGKLEYYIMLQKGAKFQTVPAINTVVTRFKGDVPDFVLYPHIFFMFLAMLLSNLTGLEALARGERILRYTFLTAASLFIGGMILGPTMQKFAFGAFWTGVPFGWDLTDNKTLVAMIGWLFALWHAKRYPNNKLTRWWVFSAAVVLLLIYSIPHSMMGSELDYSKMEVVTGE